MLDNEKEQFYADVRAVVLDHYSGLPEHRPGEAVWARLDAVLYDDFGDERVWPDFTAEPSPRAVPARRPS